MITSYPAGLHSKSDSFRVLKSIFTLEIQDFILSRMNSSPNNIKPIMVIDDNTQAIEVYYPNDELNQLIIVPNDQSNLIMRKRFEPKTGWFVRRTIAQRSNNLTIKQKEILIDIYEKFLLRKEELTQGELTALTQLEALL